MLDITSFIRFEIFKSDRLLADGTVVVCLLLARTDTEWWHSYVLGHAEGIFFIRGRLRFSGKGPAPFPSALVVFGGLNYGKEMEIS
jgi:hypothetical protein